jgi:hypothetical protein
VIYFYLDISDFLTEEVKGPANHTCETGQGCRFEEPAINALINDIFGDPYITTNCESGECLHRSQVPGYKVRFFGITWNISLEFIVIGACRTRTTASQYTKNCADRGANRCRILSGRRVG